MTLRKAPIAHGATPPHALPCDPPLPVHLKDELASRPDAWTTGLAAFRAGEYAVSAALFHRAAADGARPAALVAEASALIHLGALGRAMRTLRSALERDPEDPVAVFNLAAAQYRAGLLLDALAGAQAAVPLFRAAGLNVAPPRHLGGLIHLETGQLTRARAAFESALDDDAAYVPAALGLAQCALAGGDHAGAHAHLRRARRLVDRLPEKARPPYRQVVNRFAAALARATAHHAGSRGPIGLIRRVVRALRQAGLSALFSRPAGLQGA